MTSEKRPAARRRRAARTPPEAQLARLWASATLGAAATAADGTPVAVVYPGRPGGRSGPDFRDAVVRLGDGGPVVGDVELHRAATDFAHHGHAADPAYDGLALHVVFEADAAPATALAGGRSVPVVAADAGATPGLPVREPCATATARLGEAAVEAIVQDAARWRLARKAEALGSAIARDGAAQALYVAMATALGQQDNARAMALLASRLPLAALLELPAGPGPTRAAAMEQALLHAAGLDGALLAPAPVLPWALAGRPAAHPARRIAALAVIIDRLARPDLVSAAGALVDAALVEGGAGLVPAFVVRGAQPPAPCGRGRAVEVLVNALLPWAAIRAGVSERRGQVFDLALALPATEAYGATAHLTRNLRMATGRPLLRTPLHQQGALALLSEWCRRGGCGRCPLS